MLILSLVRNYIPSYQTVVNKGWNIADCVERSYDLEGMAVGTVAAGRIGTAVLQAPQAVRREAALHRPPPAARRCRARTRRDVPPRRRVDDPRLRRRDDQRAAAPRDRAHVQRRADRQDEARRVPGQHGARQDLRPRRGRARARKRAARRVCGRRLVPAAGAAGSPVAHDAAPRHDAARLRHVALGAGALRRRHARDPGVLVRQAPDPRGVPDRRRRQARRGRARTRTAPATPPSGSEDAQRYKGR